MGSADRRQAQNALGPRRVGQQSASVETAHAMADHGHRLFAEFTQNLMTKTSGAILNAGNRRDPRHQNAIASLPQGLRNPAKIGGQGQLSNSDPREAEQTMCQHDWRAQSSDRSVTLEEG